MMRLIALLCAGILAQAHAQENHQAELSFSIEKMWDGSDINWDPATVKLTTTADGDLKIEVSAPFFNTPIPPSDLVLDIENCPQRPHGQLYQYEVRHCLLVSFYIFLQKA